MKSKLVDLIKNVIDEACDEGLLPSKEIPDINIETPKIDTQGDFSTNIAMVMAKTQRMAPRKIADIIYEKINNLDSIIETTEIAGPGFINFFLKKTPWIETLKNVHEDENFGRSDFGNGEKIQVEFVSANPTGPLHVGHGRGAVVGDAVSSILSFCGYDVQKEYYINDSGRQINTLGRSLYYRILEQNGKEVDFPEDCYQGDYIKDLAKELETDVLSIEENQAVDLCAKYASKEILKWIASDLKDFGVTFDNWFSEQSLYDNGLVDESIKDLKNKGILYEKEDALWFNTEKYGDEKDRVVVRSNGVTTYFASDIAYHKEKFDRGFDRVIDVWGADHHGYIARMNAGIEATSKKSDNFDVVLIQLVSLLRDGQQVQMGKRSGKFVTLKDVVDEVGKDAARFMFLTRHYESSLEFDLEVAKEKSSNNPVFYVQYVHARITSIIEKASDEKDVKEIKWLDYIPQKLVEKEEIALIKKMESYPEMVLESAKNLEPHRVTFYLRDLSKLFHNYYNKHKVLVDDEELLRSRLYLIGAVKKVIKNGLDLLNISSPEKM
ncbi:MAG: arginine--tRNA ligase [Desulfobacterales bacterium]|nr:arginine--tRNA ligase [Desulfobacterales bacterium]MCP4161454.1 arginine--tRNA ligase [Deltaproteobacteria bacterium]